MLKLNEDVLFNNLLNAGLSEENANLALNEFFKLPFELTNISLDVDINKKVKIKTGEALRQEGDNITKFNNMVTYQFTCDIDGIDPMCIKSIEIPKLDYSNSNGLMCIKLEIYPFVFPIIK